MGLRPITVLMYGQRNGIPVRLEAPAKHLHGLTEALSADPANVGVKFPEVPDADQMPAANFFIDDPRSEFYGVVVNLPAGGHQLVVGDYPVPLDPPFNLHLPAPIPRTPRVHVEGLKFVDAFGGPFIWAMMDGFRDYDRYLRGEDIRPLLAEARDLGANGRRVFMMMENITRFHPQDYGEDYYRKLGAWADLYAVHGLYVEVTVFADTGLVMPADGLQQEHFRRVCDELRPRTNVFIELVNENDSHRNGVDIGRFQPPAGITACSGSNGAGANPPRPFWNYCALHPERRDERIALTTTTVFFAINGFSGERESFEGTHRATVCNEPFGFDEDFHSGRRTNDPEIAYLMGVGCAYGAGGTAHSTDGLQSVPLRPIQKECTRRFVQGVKTVSR